jgi:hypothetical protein
VFTVPRAAEGQRSLWGVDTQRRADRAEGIVRGADEGLQYVHALDEADMRSEFGMLASSLREFGDAKTGFTLSPGFFVFGACPV